jgi:hypothetical protein
MPLSTRRRLFSGFATETTAPVPIALFAATQHFSCFRGKADINPAGYRIGFMNVHLMRLGVAEFP